MKICFVTKERLSEFWERTGGEDADLIFFPLFDDVTVSYERELKGETAYFEDVALLSKACGCTVVCGYNTSTRGIVRSSAVVAENGRILGVSDALSSIDGTRNCGAFLKVYETGAGRIGVAIVSAAMRTDVNFDTAGGISAGIAYLLLSLPADYGADLAALVPNEKSPGQTPGTEENKTEENRG